MLVHVSVHISFSVSLLPLIPLWKLWFKSKGEGMIFGGSGNGSAVTNLQEKINGGGCGL